jgi:group I intron endonuclease
MRYLYKISNLINGKVYVGQTYDFAQRKAGHIYASKDLTNERPLYRSMRKHGVESFSFEVIEECADDLVDEREKFWIKHYDSTNLDKGYNLEPGGKGHTDEGRRKLSEALKGNTHCVGRVASDETRDKLRKCGQITTERRFGPKEEVTEDRTCRCGNTFRVTYSPDRKAHVRETCSEKCARARERSPETRNKISTALRFEPPEALLQAIKASMPLVQLMDDFGVSYSTLKRLKQRVKSER